MTAPRPLFTWAMHPGQQAWQFDYSSNFHNVVCAIRDVLIANGGVKAKVKS